MTAPATAATAARERPILFSAPMVRALLDGTKTQTRRVVKGERAPNVGHVWAECLCREIDPSDTPCVTCEARFGSCPYGQPGDRLWVRETFAEFSVGEGLDRPVPTCVAYRATCGDNGEFDYVNTRGEVMGLKVAKWTPSIHMPRWASRITLEVSEVRVERLHSISEEDARAEGVARERGRDVAPAMGGWDGEPWRDYLDREGWVTSARASFATLWRSINGPDSWAANPWVWAVSFRRVAT